MSRIGISPNTHQPDKRCLGCKYWKPYFQETHGWGAGGKCNPGYCKKDIIRKKIGGLKCQN